MIETIEINWELLGARLANLSDNEQGAFFKGFACELNHYESRHKAQMQMAFVSDKLSDKDKQTLEDLLPMLWLKDES